MGLAPVLIHVPRIVHNKSHTQPLAYPHDYRKPQLLFYSNSYTAIPAIHLLSNQYPITYPFIVVKHYDAHYGYMIHIFNVDIHHINMDTIGLSTYNGCI